MSMHREAEKKNVKLKPYGVEMRGILEYWVTADDVTITADDVVVTPDAIDAVIEELKEAKRGIEHLKGMT